MSMLKRKEVLIFTNRIINRFLIHYDQNKDVTIAAFLAIITLIAGSFFMVSGVAGVYHDDGIYVSTGKSLASGDGYRLINLPNSPPQTKYPPLYALILALIWKLWPAFPNNLMAMQLTTLFMASLSVGISYYYISSFGYATRLIALLAGLLTATSHFFLYFGTIPLTEAPFGLFLSLALLKLEDFIRISSSSLVQKLLLAFLITVPFLTRSIGIVLIPISITFLFLKRRPFWVIAFVCTLIISAWFIWTTMQFRQTNPIITYYTNYSAWWWQYIEIGTQTKIIGLNLLYLFYGIVTSGLTPISGLFLSNTKLWPLCIPFGIIVFIGIILGVRKQQVLPCFLSAYLFIILIWPWPPLRFIVPVLVFLLVYLLKGTWVLYERIWNLKDKRIFAFIGGGILVLGNLWQTYQVASFNNKMHYPSTIAYYRNYIAWPSFLNMFNWIKANTELHDIIASPFDSMVYLYTGRQAFRPFVMSPTSMFYGDSKPACTTKEVFETLRYYGAKYVMFMPMPGFGEEEPFKLIIDEIREKQPEFLKLIYVGEDPRFMIFRVSKIF